MHARYLRIRNLEVPGGTFALSGFRVFGKGPGEPPARIGRLEVKRNPDDRRSVSLTWSPADGATGYTVRYGSASNTLYHHHMVHGRNELTIRSLNAQQRYGFSIEAFNENGITPSDLFVPCEE